MKILIDRKTKEVAILAQQNAVIVTFEDVKYILEQINNDKEQSDEH